MTLSLLGHRSVLILSLVFALARCSQPTGQKSLRAFKLISEVSSPQSTCTLPNFSGCRVVSADGRYSFQLHNDGHLTLIRTFDRQVLWLTPIPVGATAPFRLVLQDEGNLVVYDANLKAVWATNWSSPLPGITNGPYRFEMQNDGNAVIYDRTGRPVWATNTSGGSSVLFQPYALSIHSTSVPVYPVDSSQSLSSLTLAQSGFINSFGNLRNVSLSAISAFTLDKILTSPQDYLGFSLKIATADALSGGFWNIQKRVSPPGRFAAISFDIYNNTVRGTNTQVALYLGDASDSNRWKVLDYVSLSSIPTKQWSHVSRIISSQCPIWTLTSRPDLFPPDLAQIRVLAIETTCSQTPCTADFRIDGVRYENSPTDYEALWSIGDDTFPAENPDAPVGKAISPQDGDVIYSAGSAPLVTKPWKDSQGQLQNYFSDTSKDTGSHFSTAIIGDVSHDLPSQQQYLTAQGIGSVFYSQLGYGTLQSMSNHNAWEVALTSAGTSLSPITHLCIMPGWDCPHLFSKSSPEAFSILQKQMDGILASGYGTWLAADYVISHTSRLPDGLSSAEWSASASTLSAFRANLNGTDQGLVLTGTPITGAIHFKDYFLRYNGFYPTASDLGLASWNDFALVSGQTGLSDRTRRAQLMVLGFLKSYEWVKLADRTGRYLQSKGGQGLWAMPNGEDVHGSSDYVYLLRSAGVTGLFPEYFVNIPLAAEGAYTSLPGYLRLEAGSSKRIGIVAETGPGGNSDPYQDWHTAFSGTYTLSASAQANHLVSDFLPTPFEIGRDPHSKQFARYRDGLVKGLAFLLAKATSAARASAPILVVGERPPGKETPSLFFILNIRHTFSSVFSKAHLPIDVRDSLDLESVLPRYSFVAYSPWQMRVGDDANLYNWLLQKGGRTLLTHSFVPTHAATDFTLNMQGQFSLGPSQMGIGWGIGRVVQTGAVSGTVTRVDPTLASNVSVGMNFKFLNPLTTLTGSRIPGTVLIDSTAGPLVTRFAIGSSEIIYLHFSPNETISDRYEDEDPNLVFAASLIEGIATERGIRPFVLADNSTSTQLYTVEGGQSLAAWDRPSFLNSKFPQPDVFYNTTIGHLIRIPVTSSQPYLVYDFWKDAVTSQTPSNGTLAVNLSGRANNLWYFGQGNQFQATLKMVQDLRKKLESTTTMNRRFPSSASTSSASNEVNTSSRVYESENGSFILSLQSNGQLILTRKGDNVILWSTPAPASSATGPFHFVMQGDGNLVVYDSIFHPVWASKTDYGSGEGPYQLVVQDDGNLVIFDAAGGSLWASNTAGGQTVYSDDGQFRFNLSTDGRLFLMRVGDERNLWSTPAPASTAKAPFQFVMQVEGNLVVYDANSTAVWATNWFVPLPGISNGPFRFVMQNDGNAVIYNHGGKPVWTSYTNLEPMYRVYNPQRGLHTFTADLGEYNTLVQTHHLNPEAVAFNVLTSQSGGAQPLHRLYNPNTGQHYYTLSDGERDFLVHAGWNHEKDEGLLYSQAGPDRLEVFHFFHNASGDHLYTINPLEVSTLLNTAGWSQHARLGFTQ